MELFLPIRTLTLQQTRSFLVVAWVSEDVPVLFSVDQCPIINRISIKDGIQVQSTSRVEKVISHATVMLTPFFDPRNDLHLCNCNCATTNRLYIAVNRSY